MTSTFQLKLELLVTNNKPCGNLLKFAIIHNSVSLNEETAK